MQLTDQTLDQLLEIIILYIILYYFIRKTNLCRIFIMNQINQNQWGRVVCPKFGNPALTSLFTKYKFL